MTEFLPFTYNYSFNVNKTIKRKEKNHSLLLTENFNTVAAGISLYSFYFYICSFNFLNAPAKYTYCTWK